MSIDLTILFEEIQKRGLSVAKFAKETGIPQDRIYQWQRGRGHPKAEDSRKIQNWLEQIPTVNEPTPPYINTRLNLKNGETNKKVPVWGGFTTLGNIEVIDDEGLRNKVVAELPAEVFPGCDYAEKAKGDSMYPLIMNQALLVWKKCTVKGVSYGEKYIIKTKDGLDTTKFVHPGSEPGMIKLKAYNKSIPDQEIPLADIVFTCRVYWIINPT